MHWSEVWEGKSPQSVFLRFLLTPASWLYSGGWRCYRALYDFGIKRAAEPHSPIVCIGGLAVGGSGKTPVALHVADVLQRLGRKVVISSSGYASPASEAAQVAPEGPLQASQWGDEAAMIRWLNPSIPLIVGRRRVLAAELCHRHFPGAVMLMDDGFQHLPLRKQVTMLLIDANGPNRRCLPAGPYREPYSYQDRADLVLPDQFKVAVEALRFIDAAYNPIEPVPRPANVLCALGQPQRFVAGLKAAGVSIGETMFLPDHDPLTGGNLFDGLATNAPIVVTAKDWVKLRGRSDIEGRIFWIADHRVHIEPAVEFQAWIEKKLNECAKTPQETA